MAAGRERCCQRLEQFGLRADGLAYLCSLGLDDAALEAFSGLSFTGDVLAVPDGRIVFANEPDPQSDAPEDRKRTPTTP